MLSTERRVKMPVIFPTDPPVYTGYATKTDSIYFLPDALKQKPAKKCEYCGRINEGMEMCKSCGAPLKEVSNDLLNHR